MDDNKHTTIDLLQPQHTNVMLGGLMRATGSITFGVCDAQGLHREFCRFNPDGTITVAAWTTMDEVAKAFWAKVNEVRSEPWMLAQAVDAAVVKEREACAQLADAARVQWETLPGHESGEQLARREVAANSALHIATIIRARRT